MKKSGLITLLLSGFCLLANAQEIENKTVVPLKIAALQNSVPISKIRSVGGFAGNRIEKNKENYLKTFPIEDYIKLEEQKTFKDWDWRKGEQPGKWIESAAWTVARTGDKALDGKVHEMFTRLTNSQEAEGYMGITDKAIRTPEKPLRGMDAYELYFLQHALLTVYEEWHDEKALKAAERLGDYFVKYIGEGKAEFWPSKERYPENIGKTYKGTVHSDMAGHSLHYSWEGTLLIDPMLRLYELSGDAKYLDWSTWVINNIDKWSGWNSFSKLDSVADGKMQINQIQPYVHSHTFQMNFLGFLRMYQITGDASYLRKVVGAWNDVAERQMYITGGVSVGEHYERDYIKPLTGKMIETCATMSWMQLSQYLLQLTGDTKYADAIERIMWNQVFAEQTIDGTCSRYNTPVNGTKPEGYFRTDGPDCCTGSGHRLMSMLPEFIYTSAAKGIFINQFIQSEADLSIDDGSIGVVQKTTFPQEGKISITVYPATVADFAINIRIPAWCKSATLKVNGKSIDNVIAGKYAVINRSWKNGDKIELELPMQLAWVRHEHYMKVSDKKPYKAVADTNAPYALMRGPVVYAADNIWYKGDTANRPKNVMNDVQYVLDNPASFKSVTPKGNELLGPAYMVPVALSNGTKSKLEVYPFADIGKWYLNKNDKPGPESAAYSYAVWLTGINAAK